MGKVLKRMSRGFLGVVDCYLVVCFIVSDVSARKRGKEARRCYFHTYGNFHSHHLTITSCLLSPAHLFLVFLVDRPGS